MIDLIENVLGGTAVLVCSPDLARCSMHSAGSTTLFIFRGLETAMVPGQVLINSLLDRLIDSRVN